MCLSKWFHLICFLTFIFMGSETAAYNWSCGIDNSRSSRVYVGIAEMKTYPWMGMLYYPLGKKRYTTAIILVTKQMVIASALEVDRLPKEDFRRVARIVIGKNCQYEGVRIRDYSYHPDFSNNIFSAFAMVQLEDDDVADLTPICPPPEFFIEPEFYAMTVTDSKMFYVKLVTPHGFTRFSLSSRSEQNEAYVLFNHSTKCKTARIRIFKMEHVQLDECKEFYRRTDLDVKSFWPTHTVCARALTGGKCLWRSGTALVVKQGMHWRLLGFGVYGPGCRDPARFMDYGMYHEWVYNSVARVGRTAITRIAPNHLIMRRKMSSLQRFGPCDPEETKAELYTDVVKILGMSVKSRAVYNLSLYASYEYSCIVFKAEKFKASYETTKIDVRSKKTDKKDPPLMTNPKIYLRRWCAGPPALCYGFQFLEVHFYVEILFAYRTKFSVNVYGKTAKIIDPSAVMEYRNKVYGVSPIIPTYETVLAKLIITKDMRDHFWFYNDDYGRKKQEPRNPEQPTTTTEKPNQFDGSPPENNNIEAQTKKIESTTEYGGGKNKEEKDKKEEETETGGGDEEEKTPESISEEGFLPTEVAITKHTRTTGEPSIQPPRGKGNKGWGSKGSKGGKGKDKKEKETATGGGDEEEKTQESISEEGFLPTEVAITKHTRTTVEPSIQPPRGKGNKGWGSKGGKGGKGGEGGKGKDKKEEETTTVGGKQWWSGDTPISDSKGRRLTTEVAVTKRTGTTGEPSILPINKKGQKKKQSYLRPYYRNNNS